MHTQIVALNKTLCATSWEPGARKARATLDSMTTAPAATIDWIRVTLDDGSDVTLSPSPDYELCVTVVHEKWDGFPEPLTIGARLGYRLAVDLIPLRPQDFAAVARCEARAGEMAARLGAGSVQQSSFALEAAIGGEGRPYSRMEVPCLQLTSIDPPEFDEDDPLPFVRVLTARMIADGDGVAYRMRHASP